MPATSSLRTAKPHRYEVGPAVQPAQRPPTAGRPVRRARRAAAPRSQVGRRHARRATGARRELDRDGSPRITRRDREAVHSREARQHYDGCGCLPSCFRFVLSAVGGALLPCSPGVERPRTAMNRMKGEWLAAAGAVQLQRGRAAGRRCAGASYAGFESVKLLLTARMSEPHGLRPQQASTSGRRYLGGDNCSSSQARSVGTYRIAARVTGD
jgi:hypothetical protein